MKTIEVTNEGKKYLLDIFPEKREGYCASEYVKIYKMKADGTRGYQLTGGQRRHDVYFASRHLFN